MRPKQDRARRTQPAKSRGPSSSRAIPRLAACAHQAPWPEFEDQIKLSILAKHSLGAFERLVLSTLDVHLDEINARLRRDRVIEPNGSNSFAPPAVARIVRVMIDIELFRNEELQFSARVFRAGWPWCALCQMNFRRRDAKASIAIRRTPCRQREMFVSP